MIKYALIWNFKTFAPPLLIQCSSLFCIRYSLCCILLSCLGTSASSRIIIGQVIPSFVCNITILFHQCSNRISVQLTFVSAFPHCVYNQSIDCEVAFHRILENFARIYFHSRYNILVDVLEKKRSFAPSRKLSSLNLIFKNPFP
jgi:hypothetical protein